jgi:hypothetical protein
MPPLSEQLFDDIVEQVLPYCRDQDDRRPWLTPLLSREKVFDYLNWNAVSPAFVTELVLKLSHDQLIAALRRLRPRVGEEQFPNIESLCARIEKERPPPALVTADRSVSEPKAVTGERVGTARLSANLATPSFFQILDPKTSSASRSPIIIALEEQDHPLDEDMLRRTERHLTIAFSAEQLQTLDEIGGSLSASPPLAEIVEQGRRAWQILQKAQPWLRNLVDKVIDCAGAQPIAWTGRTDLLLRVYRALLLAHTESEDSTAGFLSLPCGGQYFSPLAESQSQWTLRHRMVAPLTMGVLPPGGENQAAAMAEAAGSDVSGGKNQADAMAEVAGLDVAVLRGDDLNPVLISLAEAVRIHGDGCTRVAIGLGRAGLVPELVHDVLAQIPCLSVGGPALNDDEVVNALKHGLETLAVRQAVPCILSAVRRAWIKRALDDENIDSLLDGLLWSTWSWVGRPLFAEELGEVEPAAYPHLMHLRSVAAKGWYCNRSQGIPPIYQANSLAMSDVPPEQKFHLYVSGAGGTGKSCFLHHVYEELVHRPDVLPVWYRVDAPNSAWGDVERSIRKEIVKAAKQKIGDTSAKLIPAGDGKLSGFLREIARRMRTTDSEIKEVVVFIDQLERTFESGVEPNYGGLQKISSEIIDLLKTVKFGEGIRIYIASRKQYLPDFLRSFEAAEQCRLHFNVLQTINDSEERSEFVEGVVQWCRQQNLVENEVDIDRRAAARLATGTNGHPLNMMLALIQMLSQRWQGRITEEAVERTRPWEKLFDLDLQAVGKDEVDKYFLLAMAHARTEIVRFEEVWWRLRLVDPKLTRRVEELRRRGVLERLWLLGHLGRTIHPRPYQDDPARFLEFFHANLRDYLLRDVMGQGGAAIALPGGRWETPPAWRALDRLSTCAREWEQTQQLLTHDEVRALMQQRDVAIDKVSLPGDPEGEPFELLFLHDSDRSEARAQLCGNAKECFVFSALVYDELGRGTFEALFHREQERIDCCRRWLRRCNPEDRKPVLRYLVEMVVKKVTPAREFLTTVVLPESQPLAEELWVSLAQILSEPLHAARSRDELLAAVLEKAVVQSPTFRIRASALPSRVAEFIVAACGADRNELVKVLYRCAKHFEGLQNERLQGFAGELESNELVDDWLSKASPDISLHSTISGRERHGRVPSPVQLRLGSDLAPVVNADRVARWHSEVGSRLGVPLPHFEPSLGEVEANELQLRLRGRDVALGKFYPARSQILKRHWDRTQPTMIPDAYRTQNDALGEVVYWTDKDLLAQVNWELPAWDFDEAVTNWLEEMLRIYIEFVFDFDLLIQFVNDIAADSDISRLFYGVTLSDLRRVVMNLLHERVPLTDRGTDIVKELQQLVTQSVTDPEVLTQKLRERVRDALCRVFSDETGQLATLLLDEAYENQLLNQLVESNGGLVLGLQGTSADALVKAVRRQLERNLREDVRPVVLCPQNLRLPLAKLLRADDPRVHVLSFTELSSQINLVPAGLVTVEEPEAASV